MVDGIGRIDSDRTGLKRELPGRQTRVATEGKGDDGKGGGLDRIELSGEGRGTVAEKEEGVATRNLHLIQEAINSSLGFIDTRVAFSIHEESGEVIIQVIDNETNEVLREIPPEELVRRLSKLIELVGLLIDKRG